MLHVGFACVYWWVLLVCGMCCGCGVLVCFDGVLFGVLMLVFGLVCRCLHARLDLLLVLFLICLLAL